MPALTGSAPVQAVRTALIERLARGGPVTSDDKKAMQEMLDRWEAAGASRTDVAYEVLRHVYGATRARPLGVGVGIGTGVARASFIVPDSSIVRL